MSASSPPSAPPTPPTAVVSAIREGIIANAAYAGLIAGSLGAATLLIIINRSCGSHELPRALRMDWWLILDVGFGILDFVLKVSFFLELFNEASRSFGLVIGCGCVYGAQVLINALVELRLLAWHRRAFKGAKHEADKLLGIADMRRRPLVWNVIIFLSVLSPTILVAWPWRSRAFNGYPRMREAGVVMALVLLDDLPQIMLVALSLSLSAGSSSSAGISSGAIQPADAATGCDATSLVAGISSTKLGSLAVAVLSLLWRGVSRLLTVAARATASPSSRFAVQSCQLQVQRLYCRRRRNDLTGEPYKHELELGETKRGTLSITLSSE